VVDSLGRHFTFLGPIRSNAVPHEAVPSAPDFVPALVFGIWFCGFAASILVWFRCWRCARATLQKATPLPLNLPVPAKPGPPNTEPGVFGIRRPMLLLPEGIAARLATDEFHAILAHEMCHVRRQDNLTGAVHLAVEAVFWFHPVVWWIGARLLEERERACDETVLESGSEPRTYAEAVLAICRLCLEPPLVCVSGATGSNLRRRIETIMANRTPARLNILTMLTMVLAGVATVAIPLAIGSLEAPGLRAQPADVPRPGFEVASVKPCTFAPMPDSGRGGGGASAGDPGMFRTPCLSVRVLIQTAYVRYANGRTDAASQLKEQPVQGGPEWIDSERFVIVAEPSTPQTRAAMGGPMLQTLLEERFKLKVHREARKISAYSLIAARGGAKLQATHAGGCTQAAAVGPQPSVVPGQPLPCGYAASDANGTRAVGAPIATLCQIVSAQVHRDVIDKTGLTGLFDYTLEFSIPPPSSDLASDDLGADGFAIAAAALRKLGLELRSTTGDAEFVVIDHIERPTAN